MSSNNEYTREVAEKLTEADARTGDRVELTKGGRSIVGTLMPRVSLSASDIVTVKLDNGYNIGVRLREWSVRVVEHAKPAGGSKRKARTGGADHGDAEVAFVSTGGTIASRIEYETGAVRPALDASELVELIPELGSVASVRARVLMSVLSENLTPSDWSKISKGVIEEIQKGCKGVVVATGTDTMGYTAAALSFALRGVKIPVVLVGAQRSSDRPSSDAYINLVNAASFAKNSKLNGVFVCMHAETSDGKSVVIDGVRTRKLHTSMRSAFKPVNAKPAAYVQGSEITYTQTIRVSTEPETGFTPEFSDKASLIYFYPGMDVERFRAAAQNAEGVVIAGTGLGHVSSALTECVSTLVKSGCNVFMTSQCLWGRVNMNVYTTGRQLLTAGVVPLEDMLMETAYVKLSWALANFPREKVPEIMKTNLVGEISERSVYEEQVI
ncbi:MAG: Glu-tRNA(Gln) amidotransferase subunit GatD [Thermoprotei archaeon]